MSACLTTDGFKPNCTSDDTVFMPIVPFMYSKGLDGAIKCGDPAQNAYCYTQLSEGGSYKIDFEFERGIAERGIVSGANCATVDGIKGGACE